MLDFNRLPPGYEDLREDSSQVGVMQRLQLYLALNRYVMAMLLQVETETRKWFLVPGGDGDIKDSSKLLKLLEQRPGLFVDRLRRMHIEYPEAVKLALSWLISMCTDDEMTYHQVRIAVLREVATLPYTSDARNWLTFFGLRPQLAADYSVKRVAEKVVSDADSVDDIDQLSSSYGSQHSDRAMSI